ncbi:MAG TPA: CAP domain-containing protein [Abditibacteriaceae bacterium]|jgi:uncharacterized protein YkwD
MKPRFLVPLSFLTACVVTATLFSTPVFSQNAAPEKQLEKQETKAANDDAILARYQLALDQLATGGTGTARVILEDSIRRYGPRPEVNLLLAYVLQREGNNQGALAVANQVAQASSLATAFSAQLQGVAVASVTNTQTSPTTSVINNFPVIVPASVPVTVTAQNGASLGQNDARLTKLEHAMRDMINAERAKAGLGELKWNDDLANVSRAHAAEMRDKNYFSHDSPTRGLTTHLDRYRAAGHAAPRVIAENIFRAWGSPKQVDLSDVQKGHEALMNSPGHRANILYRDVTNIGIGIAVSAKGDLWITQMFLRP